MSEEHVQWGERGVTGGWVSVRVEEGARAHEYELGGPMVTVSVTWWRAGCTAMKQGPRPSRGPVSADHPVLM